MKFPLVLFGYLMASFGLVSTAFMIYICYFLPQCNSGGVSESDPYNQKSFQQGLIIPVSDKQIDTSSVYIQGSGIFSESVRRPDEKKPDIALKAKQFKNPILFFRPASRLNFSGAGALNILHQQKIK